MEPTFITRRSIRLAGVAAKGHPKDIDFNTIWNAAFMQIKDALAPLSVDGGYYGAWFPQPDGVPIFMAGMAVGEHTEIPTGVEVRTMPAATYAVFLCELEHMLDTVKMAFDQWLPASTQYRLDEAASDFEFFPKAAADGSFQPAVYIPVLEKQLER